jgi:hypothetical protein
MTTSKLPRFDIAAGALARSGADRLVRPLPPVLARLVEDTEEAKAHAGVSARYSAARTRVAGLREAIVAAKAKDAAGERAALGRGTKPPKQQAPALEDELADAERQLGILDGLVVEYAGTLLKRAVECLPEALEQAQRSLDSALADVRNAIDSAVTTLASANESAAELGWLRTLAGEGLVHAYIGGKSATVLPSVSEALARASAAFDYDLERRVEWREEVERQREFEESRLPDGTHVWKDGRSYVVVGDRGELVEVEDAER